MLKRDASPQELQQYREDADILAHRGDEYERHNYAVVPPVYLNSLYVTPKAWIGEPRPQDAFSYTRESNHTIDILEQKIAALERADRAQAFGSGMAAITAVMRACVKSGGHVVAVRTMYGPNHAVLERYFAEDGVEYTYVEGDDLDELEAAIRPNTQLIYLESPSTMVFKVQDLRAIAAIAKKRGIATAIDNSWATPIYQKPIQLGIDFSLHSVTKYLNGHSDVVAGVVSGGAEPMQKVHDVRSLYGGILGPMEAWLVIRGMRSLQARLRAHGESAMVVAERLQKHPAVSRVHYPGLPSDLGHALACSQMSGFTSLLSFELANGEAVGDDFVRRLQWFCMGPSWGGFESLVAHPGNSALVRIHVGLENVETLWADLEASLDKAR